MIVAMASIGQYWQKNWRKKIHYSCSMRWFLKAYMQGKKLRQRPRICLQTDYSEETIFHTEFWQYE
jgi:hypothetical protein